MSENRKGERVRVLGVHVDSIKVERAVQATTRYLEKHKFEYIIFANTPTALAGQEKESLKEYIDQAALVLPGDGNIEDAVEVRSFLKEGTLYQAEYFRRLFTKLNKQHGSLFVLAQKEDQLSVIDRIVKEKYSRLHYESILWQEEVSADTILNGINSLSPDILFLCGNHEEISFFLKEHCCKINAGLCFCMEEIVTDQETDISDLVTAGVLGKQWKKIGGSISRLFHNHLFKQQLKQEQKTNGQLEEEGTHPDEMTGKE